jgi:structural toxin protein (hemagglutinin/hemolysin) RtxA
LGPFFLFNMSQIIQIVVFIPLTHKDQVKEAMFAAGGGRIGHYDCCSFEIPGLGQFRALEGSSPFLGSLNRVEEVAEIRLEMSCREELYDGVIEAMLRAHPYENPAYYAMAHYKSSSN